MYLGGITFVPDFDEMGSEDQWYDFVGGSGKLRLGVSYQPNYGQSLTIDDFELMTVIGKGSFGKVCASWGGEIFFGSTERPEIGYASPQT